MQMLWPASFEKKRKDVREAVCISLGKRCDSQALRKHSKGDGRKISREHKV